MSGVAQMEQELLALRAKVRELEREKTAELPNCIGCLRMERHTCGAFCICPYFGAIDPERDGCRRKKVAE